ncbi:hypothetical protein OG21DRAFT_527591 [Imleria badia]|nr:hypothetical protein OG21DRAFT_527591 [Imleria badia]
MTIRMTTPSESREDFHAMLTISDNDYSESDEESIKASRISSRADWSSVASFTERRDMYEPESPGSPVEYDEKGVGAAFEDVKVVEVIREVEVVKEVEVIREVEIPVEVLKEIEKPIEVVKARLVEVTKERHTRQDTLLVLLFPLMEISNAAFNSWMLGDLTRVEDLLTEEITHPFHHARALARRALVRSRLKRWDMINDAKKSIEVQRSVFGHIANAWATSAIGTTSLRCVYSTSCSAMASQPRIIFSC